MNTKEPEPGEYWYVIFDKMYDKYENKPIKLIKIKSNIRLYNQKSIIAFIFHDYFETLALNTDFKSIIWVKQWKPNWFYRMIGY